MPNAVEVRSRATLVAADASLHDLAPENEPAAAVFVELLRPMPVGTTLALSRGDTVRHARVVRVAEVPEHGHAGRVGCFLSWLGEAQSATEDAAAQMADDPGADSDSSSAREDVAAAAGESASSELAANDSAESSRTTEVTSDDETGGNNGRRGKRRKRRR